MADIIYSYAGSYYVNITNRCNCRCTFCIRKEGDGLGDAKTLWHEKDPTEEEVLQAIRSFDFKEAKDLIFCGYGEPTSALSVLLAAARCAKQEKGMKLRLNTNGLGSLQNGKDIVPELAQWFDSVSISLNAPDESVYERVSRPILKGSYEAMRAFSRRAKELIPDVRWTVVDVLLEEEKEACRRIAREEGISLRIRPYI